MIIGMKNFNIFNRFGVALVCAVAFTACTDDIEGDAYYTFTGDTVSS